MYIHDEVIKEAIAEGVRLIAGFQAYASQCRCANFQLAFSNITNVPVAFGRLHVVVLVGCIRCQSEAVSQKIRN